MGTLRERLLGLLGERRAESPAKVDDTDSAAAPHRLEFGPDMIGRADVTTTGFGDYWPGSASNDPVPVDPHMSRREAREWERLRAHDAEGEQPPE